jgi:zinc D-Ala-D-Ala carboxypeptidase
VTAQVISWLVTIGLLIPTMAGYAASTGVLVPAAPDRPVPVCVHAEEVVRSGLDARPPTTLVDIGRRLPPGYTPPQLVTTAGLPLSGVATVRRIVLDDLRALARAAREAGHTLAIRTAYRSEAFQEVLFRDWVRREGREAALRRSARGGHSEHQLGTAIDFAEPGARPPWEYGDWAETPIGGWLAEHAWQHGFVMSYSRGDEATTCYGYEPWHYRYVGRAAARAIRELDITLREYLWLTTDGASTPTD